MKTCPKCQKEKEPSTFRLRKDGRLAAYCKACEQTYKQDHYIQHKEDYKRRAKVSNPKRRAKLREFVNSLKAGPCVDCKKDFPPWVMQFDHLSGKVASVSRILANGATLARLVEEIKKCELVCANCHANRTYFRIKPTLAPVVQRQTSRTQNPKAPTGV